MSQPYAHVTETISDPGPRKFGLEKIFFGTDYPGFLYDPVKLRNKLMTVNEEAAAVSLPAIPERKLVGIMGANFAAVLGLRAA